MNNSPDWEKVRSGLEAKFDDKDLEWMPKMKRNGRQMWLCYIDARAVEKRLDDVVGMGNWHDEYERWGQGRGVLCKLTIFGVTKQDAADESDIESTKGGVSNALKRAAVKFGVGRYLYDGEPIWLPEDERPQGRFVEPVAPVARQQRRQQPSPGKGQEPTGTSADVGKVLSSGAPWLKWVVMKNKKPGYTFASAIQDASKGEGEGLEMLEWVAQEHVNRLKGQSKVTVQKLLAYLRETRRQPKQEKEDPWLDVAKELDAAFDGEGGEVVEPTADEMGWR